MFGDRAHSARLSSHRAQQAGDGFGDQEQALELELEKLGRSPRRPVHRAQVCPGSVASADRRRRRHVGRNAAAATRWLPRRRRARSAPATAAPPAPIGPPTDRRRSMPPTAFRVDRRVPELSRATRSANSRCPPGACNGGAMDLRRRVIAVDLGPKRRAHSERPVDQPTAEAGQLRQRGGHQLLQPLVADVAGRLDDNERHGGRVGRRPLQKKP